MIKSSTIAIVESLLKQLRDLRDTEYRDRSEVRSAFNAAADKLDLLEDKLQQGYKKCGYRDGKPRQPKTFNDGVEAASTYLRQKTYVNTPSLFNTFNTMVTRVSTRPELELLADAVLSLKVPK